MVIRDHVKREVVGLKPKFAMCNHEGSIGGLLVLSFSFSFLLFVPACSESWHGCS